jgi:hypothetical protein
MKKYILAVVVSLPLLLLASSFSQAKNKNSRQKEPISFPAKTMWQSIIQAFKKYY